MIEHIVTIITGTMMRCIRSLASNLEKLHALMTLDQQELFKQPTSPRSFIIGGRRHRHIMIDPVVLTTIRIVSIITHRGDDQGQTFRTLTTINSGQTYHPAWSITTFIDQLLKKQWVW